MARIGRRIVAVFATLAALALAGGAWWKF